MIKYIVNNSLFQDPRAYRKTFSPFTHTRGKFPIHIFFLFAISFNPISIKKYDVYDIVYQIFTFPFGDFFVQRNLQKKIKTM